MTLTEEPSRITDAFYTTTRALTVAQRGWLRRQGVPPDAFLGDGDAHGWPIRQARVERLGKLFRFTTEEGEGVPAIIIVARDQAGQGVDLVAWSAREGWVASESGTLPLLGAEALCSLGDEPVEVHADVLAWLRAGRRGVVVLDQRRAVPVLRECRALVVGDVTLGERLERSLTVKTPRILVKEAA